VVTVKVTLPSGEIKMFTSLNKASKELGIDINYGLTVCAKKNDFKGRKIVKLQDPLVESYKRF